MSATLHEPPIATIQDIPRVLRSIADEMEAGGYGRTTACAIVIETTDGTIRTFGGGAAEYYRSIALFTLGIENLIAKRGREAIA